MFNRIRRNRRPSEKDTPRRIMRDTNRKDVNHQIFVNLNEIIVLARAEGCSLEEFCVGMFRAADAHPAWGWTQEELQEAMIQLTFGGLLAQYGKNLN